MRKKILRAITVVILFLTPHVNFGQAPALGTAANFVLFTTNGAVTNSGIPHLTHLTGNVGSNLSASVTGFGNVDGVMHDFDVASGAATGDLVNAYNQLNDAIPTFFPAPLLGGGDTLVAGVYAISGATTLNLNLILNAQGNPNAVFIFQINGTLSTGALSKVVLINGGLACNVFWKVEGLVSMATGSTMRGTIVAHNAAINMGALDTLEGRALSINGAITTNSVLAYTPIGCGSATLTGPAAPALVSTAAYGIFSSIGPVTGTGLTRVTGDVGTNSGLTSGFDPLLVSGMIHPSPDASTAAAAADLTNVYNYLNTLVPDIDLLDPANFGYGLVLTPHSYLLAAATMLTGNVYLNAEGDANAVFIIQVNGAFATSTFSGVKLINGAQAKNVYWLINGATHVYDNSIFNGNIIGAGAITFNTGDTLNGRAFTINGAVNINGSDINVIAAPCVAPVITGVMSVCPGATTALADSSAGGVWSSTNMAVATVDAVSGVVTGLMPGNSGINYTTTSGCIRNASITVNAAPSPITGPASVCAGSAITLADTTTGGSWTSSNVLFATVGSASGIVTGVATGTSTISYAVPGGCFTTASVMVGPMVGAISGPSSVCIGTTIALIDTTTGGIWSSSNSSATIAGGLVTGITAGFDTIVYSVTNACGVGTASMVITVNPFAGLISGLSNVCIGSSVTLAESIAGGTWSSSNTNATITGGIVTGFTAGIDTITYAVNSVCGIINVTRAITINATPVAGIISGAASVCVGAVVTLSDLAAGGIWSSSNANATVGPTGVVSGVTAGTAIVSYLVSNLSCSAVATKMININPLPDPGSISGASVVCLGASVTLTDGIAGGSWTTSNVSASVVGGVVTGTSAGIDTILYTVTNTCGFLAATTTINVITVPVAGVITGALNVCVGASVTLADAIAGGVWSASNANAVVTGGIVSGMATGIDVITYLVSNSCGTTPATAVVTINAFPVTAGISGLSKVCAGAAITLTDATTGGVWSTSNSATASVLLGTATGVTAGTDTIKYSVTNLCGTAVATKVITVNPIPNVITPANQVLCNGALTAAVNFSGAVSGTLFSWTNDNTSAGLIFPSGIGNIAAYLATNTTSVPLTSTIVVTPAANGCTGASQSFTILVNPTPDVVIPASKVVCNGTAVPAMSFSGSVTGTTFGWSNNLASIGIGTSGTGTIPAFTAVNTTGLPFVATILVTPSANGCSGLPKSFTITVNPSAPAPSITLTSPASVCDSVFFQNFGAATLPPSGVSYSWSAANAKISETGSTGQYALVNFKTSGTAVVTLTASMISTGCSADAVYSVNVGTDKADVPPQVVYFKNSFVCLQNNETGFQWGYDDAATLAPTIIQGAINQDYVISNPDVSNRNYWVMVANNGCFQKAYYNKPSGATYRTSMTTVNVYPNPANATVTVEINTTEPGNLQLEILNMLGQKLFTAPTVSSISQVNVSAFPAGIYIINCYRDGLNISTSRFTKN